MTLQRALSLVVELTVLKRNTQLLYVGANVGVCWLYVC